MSALAPKSRITGLDMARALAIFGMFMAHIGPRVPEEGIPNPDLVGATYRVVHGRSAILFGVLAGVGVTILASRGIARLDTDFKLGWRALVLFVLGLWLQTFNMPVAIILHYYAILFLIGALATRLGNRILLVTGAASLILGPLVILGMWSLAPDLSRAIPEWFRLDQQMFFILVAGYYPIVTWTAPFLFGMWVGRHDLSAPDSPWRLMGAGVAMTAIAYLVSIAATAVFGKPGGESDWRNLVTIEPHNQMPLWLISTAGIAFILIGLCILLTRRFPRVTRPVVLVGQMAFTVYVAQIVVLTIAPNWVAATGSYGAAWLSIGRMMIVTVILVMLYRSFADRGPFEWLIRAPWSLPRESGRIQPTP